jgi:hypothetical protein
MSKTQWNYCGDINIEHGGYFWREDGADDYVLCVRVTPCSDAGGPDNMFWIEHGSIYLPDDAEKRKRALDCCGWIDDAATTTRAQLVDAFLAYYGSDTDAQTVVRVGPKQDGRREWNDETQPDKVLRSNASLENYVRNNFLN